VTFLSGDVHCAAVGLLHTYYGHHGEPKDLEPSKDHRYMMNVSLAGSSAGVISVGPPIDLLFRTLLSQVITYVTVVSTDSTASLI
jgi:hypothetical protein